MLSYSLMLSFSWHERNKPMTPLKGEAKLILVSSHSVRKRLSLLALASTMPLNCLRPESLRHRKDNRDQNCVFCTVVICRRSERGFCFSIFADLSSLFRQNPVSGRAADCSGSKIRCSRGHLPRRSSSQKGLGR